MPAPAYERLDAARRRTRRMKPPSAALPRRACDSHFHVFEERRFPYAANRDYTPADAPLERFRAVCEARGIERAVLVQPSVFGTDHRCLEQTLRDNGDWLRGVAVVHSGAEAPEDRTLERWHQLGVRGARVNALFAGGADPARLAEIAARVRGYGWHLQLLIDVAAAPRLAPQAAALGLPVVVDHFGHHAAAALRSSEGFANLLALVREGRAWVKLSAPYRVSRQAPGWPDAHRVVDALLDAGPERLLWGSDWPHPSNPAQPFEAPSDDAIGALLFAWLPTPQLRQQVLADNPARLYWDAELPAYQRFSPAPIDSQTQEAAP